MAYVDHITVDGVEYDIQDKEAVSFAQAQTLTAAQQAQAQENMGAASAADVSELKSHTSGLIYPIEIGINRFLENGKIKVAENSSRASIAPTILPVDKIYILVKTGYTANIFLFNDSWSAYSGNTLAAGSYTVEVDGYSSFCVQVVSGSAIPAGSTPVVVSTDILNEIKEKCLIELPQYSDEYIQGSLNNNDFFPNNAECITTKDYIPITEYDEVVIRENDSTGKWKFRISFYNSSKTFLSQYGYEYIGGEFSYTKPSTAAYARICLSKYENGTGVNTSPSDVGSNILFVGGYNVAGYIISTKTREIAAGLSAAESKLENIKTKNTYLLSVPIEIGVNRFVSSGKLTVATNSTRASTPPQPVPVDKKIYVETPATYKTNVFVCASGTWTVLVSESTDENITVDLTGYEFFSIQVLSTGNIPTNTNPVNLMYNIPGEIMRDRNEMAVMSYDYDASAYTGERVDVSRHYFVPELYFKMTHSVTQSVQGGASYGKYYFQFANYCENCAIYNLETQSLEQLVTLTSNQDYHCNVVNFGTQFYSNDDVFPLLYVSNENASVHNVLVFRVSGAPGSLEFTLIQTITFDAPSTSGVYYQNAMVDRENNRLIQMGYTTNSYTQSASNSIIFNIFEMPDISSSSVDLHDADKIKSFTIPSETATQCGFCQDGKIYLPLGQTSATSKLYVIDIERESVVSRMPLTGTTAEGEPEAAFVYNDTLYIAGVNKNIYKIRC